MKLKSLILPVILLLMGCSELTILRPMPENGGTDPQVRNLTLKYSLISSAYEIYQTQVLQKAPFTKATYEKLGKNAPEVREHYEWMETTYEEMPWFRQQQLRRIFSRSIDWSVQNYATRLADEATIDDITALVKTLPDFPLGLRNLMGSFYPYYYENHFKSYFTSQRAALRPKIDALNKALGAKQPIIPFMEKESGISFPKKIRPLFYMTLRPIGAGGFQYGELKISTIQQTVSETTLYSTPFHEFSHELFDTFTESKHYLTLCEELKRWPALVAEQRSSYDWPGWCEENVVEGFAQYLNDRFAGHETVRDVPGIYTCDAEFYRFLKEQPFQPAPGALEKAVMTFYRGKLSGIKGS